MSSPGPPEDVRLVDRLRDEFEAEWKAGRRPDLQHYLARAPLGVQPNLLRELLALEVEYRLRRGETPLEADYRQRFTQSTDLVEAVFSQTRAPLEPTEPYYGKLTLTLKVTDGPGHGQSYTFAGAQTLYLGRSRKAHISVPDESLSRLHFCVELTPTEGRLTDLKSRNGTRVNGRCVQTAKLGDGDTVHAGQTMLKVVFSMGAGSFEDAEAAVTKVLPVMAAAAPPAAPAHESSGTFSTIHSRPSPEPAAPLGATLAPPTPRPATFPVTNPTLLTIKGYQLDRELGRGGMGVVYLARRESDSQRVALKVIKTAVTAQSRQMQRFLREANILRQLDHHHIVHFLEVSECNGQVFIAMEYIEGTDAAMMLKQQERLGIKEAVRMVCQLLSALKYAHERRFVHRDIKPANMLVADEQGKKSVKLADFGLARVCQDSQVSELTLPGEVGGTMAFMPPEQLTEFRNVTPAADQYSAAATLYNLLSGKYLFDFKDNSVPATSRVLNEEPIPLRSHRPEVPEELSNIIQRALAKTPEQRFASVHEFRAALTQFAK